MIWPRDWIDITGRNQATSDRERMTPEIWSSDAVGTTMTTASESADFEPGSRRLQASPAREPCDKCRPADRTDNNSSRAVSRRAGQHQKSILISPVTQRPRAGSQ